MVNHRTEANVKLLDGIIANLVEVLKEFHANELQHKEAGKELNQLQGIANQFLDRTIVNMLGVKNILPSYARQHVAIFPIGLILRSVFSDFISFLYLLSFTKRGTDINQTFLNELNMVDRDFVRAFIEMKTIEGELDQYMSVLPKGFKGKVEVDKEISELKAGSLKRFFTKNGEFKNASEIRHDSDPTLFHSDEAFKIPKNTFMTESYKWKQVKSDPDMGKFVIAYHSYKIFSSFQHYSLFGNQWLTKSKEDFLFVQLILGVNAIFILLDFIVQIIDKPDSEFVAKLKAVSNEINKMGLKDAD